MQAPFQFIKRKKMTVPEKFHLERPMDLFGATGVGVGAIVGGGNDMTVILYTNLSFRKPVNQYAEFFRFPGTAHPFVYAIHNTFDIQVIRALQSSEY